MVNRNAKNLILLSRSGAISHSAQNLLEELESRGINVATPKCDISKLEMLVAALKECNKIMPPIKGCIQAAMALEVGPCFHFQTLSNHHRLRHLGRPVQEHAI